MHKHRPSTNLIGRYGEYLCKISLNSEGSHFYTNQTFYGIKAISILNICQMRFGPGLAFSPVTCDDIRVLFAKFQANRKGRKKWKFRRFLDDNFENRIGPGLWPSTNLIGRYGECFCKILLNSEGSHFLWFLDWRKYG